MSPRGPSPIWVAAFAPPGVVNYGPRVLYTEQQANEARADGWIVYGPYVHKLPHFKPHLPEKVRAVRRERRR